MLLIIAKSSFDSDTHLLNSQLTAPLQGLGQLVEAALVTLDSLLASDSEDS